MKILHTADWQVGKHFRNIPGDAGAVLRQQRFETVKRIADLARDKAVSAVLVAGDVYDDNAVSDETLRRTINAMSGYDGPWVLLAGNHDAAKAQSVWTRMTHLKIVPDNVILATEPKPIELARGKLYVLPAPLQRRHETRDLTEYFDGASTPQGALRVGLAHGSVSNRLPDKAESMNPVADSRADTANLHYLALGDWHGTLEIAHRTWYSGTPEQDRFKENDPGNVLLVELKNDQPPSVEVILTGKFSWTKVEFQCESEGSVDLLKQQLNAVEKPNETLVDLRLFGMIDLQGRYRLEQLREEFDARFHFLKVDDDELKSTPSDEDLATMGATGFLAETVKKLVSIQEDTDDPDTGHAARAMQILYFEQLAQAQKT